MGIIDDFNKISKFQEKYAFLNDSKFRKVVSGLTNGLVTTAALEHMNLHITNLAEGIKLIDVKKENTKQYDEIWDKLQKGFIDYAYEMYQPKPGEKRLSKNAYFNLVIDAIEMCPHEKVVETKEWCKIYNIALTEKEAYNNQKNLEFVEKAAKIEDMHKRYEKARDDYATLNYPGQNGRERRIFKDTYGNDIEKLDHEIAKFENSKEYKDAKDEIEKYHQEYAAAENLYNNAKGAYDVAKNEYKTFLKNTAQTVFEKHKELLNSKGFQGFYRNPESFIEAYERHYKDKVNALAEARKLKEEVDAMKPEFSAAMDKLSVIDKEIKQKDGEISSIDEKITEIHNKLEAEYKAKLEAEQQEELEQAEIEYKKLFGVEGYEDEEEYDEEYDEEYEEEVVEEPVAEEPVVEKKLSEFARQQEEIDRQIEEEIRAKAEAEKLDKVEEAMKLKRKELEKIKERKIDDYSENLKIEGTDEIKKLKEEKTLIDKERTDLKSTKKSLEKTVEKFDEKLREFRTPLYKWNMLPDRTELETQLQKESLDVKRREVTLKIDLEIIAKHFEPFREMENAVKAAREKLMPLEKRKRICILNFLQLHVLIKLRNY